MNSMKQKPKGKSSSAYGIKKPCRAEVNYCPSYPSGETPESLERVRVALLSEVKKKDNDPDLCFKKTRGCSGITPIADFRTRWPALFRTKEVSAEFERFLCCHGSFQSWICTLQNY